MSEASTVPFKSTHGLEKATIKITEEKLTKEQFKGYREGLLKSSLN